MQPNSKPPTLPENSATPSAAMCENCGTPLYGKYCYACGQPAHGLVRHFGSVLSDIADSVFNIDERLFHSIWPLYLRPGRLTLDYFKGRRARYVTPFRLVFFLAIIAFFATRLAIGAGFGHGVNLETPAIAGTSIHIRSSPVPHEQSRDSQFAHGNITLNGKVLWNRQTKPLRLGWLPGVANDWINDLIGNARVNMHDLNSGSVPEEKAARRRISVGMYAAAPAVLFVLLPIFALLLKFFYFFKQRLYMEHLIVAMHSHAFLMLSMLLLTILGVLKAWLGPRAAALTVLFDLLEAAAWIWIFVYLFWMQKRVYRQGWIMTTLKYGCVGVCYSVLLLCGFIVAFLVSVSGA